MIKILIGGSPCTYWSIAQKNNREVEAEGLGWELFKNYLTAKEKFNPDFFLYENNKSASGAIKNSIKKELMVDNISNHYIEINSALVSAQNRQRFYVHSCGTVEQPIDRCIALKDILESNVPMRIPPDKARGGGKPCNLNIQQIALMTMPIRIGGVGKSGQGNRIYSINGKAVAQTATSGGLGSNTGLYAVPCDNVGNEGTVQKAISNIVGKIGFLPEMFNAYNSKELEEKAPTLSTGSMVSSSCATLKIEKTDYPIYEVSNGQITIKGKIYPIKLTNGYYFIRKLSVTECCRLQTMPDNYCKAVSNAQAYKGLGNGWTAEVIIHILQNALQDIPKDEKILVLSMYDGIGTGRYCLDKMHFTNIEYHAYEIDKYAIKVALSNYPDIIQHGDAFALREDNWSLNNKNIER